jgi:hypothetical protein
VPVPRWSSSPVGYAGAVPRRHRRPSRAAQPVCSMSAIGRIAGAGALVCQRLTERCGAFVTVPGTAFCPTSWGGRRCDYLPGQAEAYSSCVNASNVDKDFAWLANHAGTMSRSTIKALVRSVGATGRRRTILQLLMGNYWTRLPFQLADVAAVRRLAARRIHWRAGLALCHGVRPSVVERVMEQISLTVGCSRFGLARHVALGKARFMAMSSTIRRRRWKRVWSG